MTPEEQHYLDQIRIGFLDAKAGGVLPIADRLREHIRVTMGEDISEETAGRILLATGGFFSQFNIESFPGDRGTLQALMATCLMAASFMIPWLGEEGEEVK